ncbi:MAG TPA: KOW domain-containing RNA-binding protein [Ruminiclostridium sp.]
MDVVLGQVVYSKAGRDEGKIFVITQLIESNYVYISDGDLRRVDNPKKKKIKHLVITKDIIETIAKKISIESKITNAEIRKALVEIKRPIDVSE